MDKDVNSTWAVIWQMHDALNSFLKSRIERFGKVLCGLAEQLLVYQKSISLRADVECHDFFAQATEYPSALWTILKITSWQIGLLSEEDIVGSRRRRRSDYL